ncbi:hypothetical protein evm_009266 [Chilo suppressalis]|nr:hypothetical protein evm_009266 [Chilo suppressalis]
MLSRWSRLLLQSLASTNPHWARVAKQMIVGSDGQLYEIDDNAKQEILDDVDDDDNDVNGNDDIDEQNAEPMEIYLDEVEGNVIEKLKSQKPLKKVKRVVIEESDDTDDEEITYKKRYVKTSTDSLDKFGSYLVSLLRQLPKADSNRLQADFVKQIMNCQSEEGIVVSDSYVTTIAECKDDLVADSSASNDDVLVQTTIVDSDCQ